MSGDEQHAKHTNLGIGHLINQLRGDNNVLNKVRQLVLNRLTEMK